MLTLIEAFICLQSLMIQDVEHQLGSPLRTEPQASLPAPLVIIISGSSGVGKDAVIKVLVMHL
jgi:guanylate kinase